MKPPSHYAPRYVCRAVRKLLAKQGWPIQKTTGTYSPFGGTKAATEGFRVHRVGVGKCVSVSYGEAYSHQTGRRQTLCRDYLRAREQAAQELLRAHGYRLNAQGWIECEHHDS